MSKSDVAILPFRNNKVNDFEIVERKGIGHPDTLSDALAEELSRVYSNYTLSKFGVILHHNFDKVGLCGGESFVKFGGGHLIKPIRILINGRASISFGDKNIHIKELLETTACNFLTGHFPNIDKEKDIDIFYNISTSSSPGKVNVNGQEADVRKYMFKPRGIYDLKELTYLGSNDTSIGASYAPFSATERIVLEIENQLNSTEFKRKQPFIGSDIKILACRIKKNLEITACIPQIASFVSDIQNYSKNKEKIREEILRIIDKLNSEDLDITLYINTKDRMEINDIYLTAIGSAIESGDEGLVGRGNRVNGLITPCRPMVMEGACGKNPVYHVGKLYNIAARQIAQKIYEFTGNMNEVYLASQNGHLLIEPWHIVVMIESCTEGQYRDISEIINEELIKIPKIKESLLKGKISLF